MKEAISSATSKNWDREAILDYARSNSWDSRVIRLEEAFSKLALGS
jgi:hypothetical protein